MSVFILLGESHMSLPVYPNVFLYNPWVNNTLNFNSFNYLSQYYIEVQKVKSWLHNPYLETVT